MADGFFSELGYRSEILPARDTGEASAWLPAKPPADALPDGRPGFGLGDIREAWLIAPTERYGHGVLGDAVEAGGLLVKSTDGRTHRFMLPDDSVFEDLHPRVADLDGDGRDEVAVVKSYLRRGAALAVFGLRDGMLASLGETPAIGQANRWLNPAGIADFDGDGNLEIAYVETPHIGGTLHLYRLAKDGLRRLASKAGFSNHAIGSRALGLSLAHDLDGDGRAELILPEMGRRVLAVLAFTPDGLRVRERIELPAAVTGDFDWSDEKRSLHVPLADGKALRLVR